MRISIAVKIFAIALGLLALMIPVTLVSNRLAERVAHDIDRLTTEYLPAYGALARANVRTLEQGLALRRYVIAALESPPDEAGKAANLATFNEKNVALDEELQAARNLLNAQIANNQFADAVELARLETRIALLADDRQHYDSEVKQMLAALADGARDRRSLANERVERIRDEMNAKMESIRNEMLELARAASARTQAGQAQLIKVGLIVMGLAALLGLLLAGVVSLGLVRPLRRLVEGTRAVEAGRLDMLVPVTSRDEVGRLTQAFNHMVGQLRIKDQIRETFGKYIDPRVVEGLIDRPSLTASEGQRRTMTVLFCDMKGFTALSEGMTPKALVNVINRYLTVMSEPIRRHNGIIDKYIGDAIMAYWGPPFVEESQQARLACFAALDMVAQLALLQDDLPELMGLRTNVPKLDLRIGIATGEVLVGSIGSAVMMSYTVMGDTVNFASRLEGANKAYGTRLLISEATAMLAHADIEAREIDRLVVVGKTEPERVFELMARAGELSPERGALRARFTEGLEAYRARSWSAAREGFEACLADTPTDGPAHTFLQRVEHFVAEPPDAAWKGVWVLDHK